MKKKWIPIENYTKIREKEKYKYEFGWYNHEKYGICFRISKYLKRNDYFIGHFVMVGSDLEVFEDISTEFKLGILNGVQK